MKKTGPVRILPAIVTGSLCAVLASILLLLPCAVLVSAGKAPESGMPAMTMAVCLIGAFIGSMAGWSRIRSRALLVGAGVGALTFALLFGVGLIFSSAPPDGGQVLCILLAVFVGAILGGVARLTRKKRRK